MTPSCKDCLTSGVTTKRPALHPGPRCTSHHRVVVAARKQRKHDLHVERQYGLSAADYAKLLDAQNGRCYVCQRSTGAARRLAVDHDHNCNVGHPPDMGCRRCVRALLCKTCNRIVLGRYSPAALRRAIEVFEDPPARKVLS